MTNPKIVTDLISKPNYSKKQESHWWRSTMILATLWFIWFAQCQRIFNNAFISPQSLFQTIMEFTQEQHILTKWSLVNRYQEVSQSTFQFIIHSDGSFVDEQSLAGIDWTINDQQYNLITCGASPVRFINVTQTELMTLLGCLMEAKRRNLEVVIVLRILGSQANTSLVILLHPNLKNKSSKNA